MEKKRMENKMQDSQKTKDELWNRLWKEFGQLVYMESMNEHVKRGANGDLVDFIKQELDRAREEGREEIRQLLRDKKQVQEFLKENPKFYKGKKIETAGIATLTKF